MTEDYHQITIQEAINKMEKEKQNNRLTLEQYMQFTGMTHEDLHKQYEETATNRVKERFLLERESENSLRGISSLILSKTSIKEQSSKRSTISI